MPGDGNFNNVNTDTAQIIDLQAGNLIVNGAARFLNDIQGNIAGSKDINSVTASTSIPDTYYIFMSDGTGVKRILFPDFVNAIRAKLS